MEAEIMVEDKAGIYNLCVISSLKYVTDFDVLISKCIIIFDRRNFGNFRLLSESGAPGAGAGQNPISLYQNFSNGILHLYL
jgi:hypothetical protein